MTHAPGRSDRLSPLVLNVNDDPGARYLVTRILRQQGFASLEARTGDEALAVAREHLPDVVVLDINLPDRNGYEVCRLLKADPLTSAIAIIQTSATFTTSERKARGFQSGADAYLTQPFESIELVAMIESLVRLRAAQNEASARAAALLEADRRKDEFLAMLGHELRNPLSAMTTSFGLLESRVGDDELSQRLLQTLQRQARHLGKLVDDLLDVSRITQGKIVLRSQPVDLVAAVRDVVDGLRPELARTRNALEVELPDGVLVIHADSTRVEQILINVVGNAAKYSAPGAPILVRVERVENTARVIVRDRGIGVAREHLPRLFDAFYQVDPTLARTQSGLGLGLTMVKRLVELHGGAVHAESEGRERGTEVVITLPLRDVQTIDREHSGVLERVHRALRVLLVDDNADSCEIFQMALRQAGHDVEIAFDGERGLELATTRPFDVAVLDIGLPLIDGYELARRICAALGEERPHLVALTGYGRPEDRARAFASGFDQHLVKPIDATDLERAFSVVGAPRAAARAR